MDPFLSRSSKVTGDDRGLCLLNSVNNTYIICYARLLSSALFVQKVEQDRGLADRGAHARIHAHPACVPSVNVSSGSPRLPCMHSQEVVPRPTVGKLRRVAPRIPAVLLRRRVVSVPLPAPIVAHGDCAPLQVFSTWAWLERSTGWPCVCVCAHVSYEGACIENLA